MSPKAAQPSKKVGRNIPTNTALPRQPAQRTVQPAGKQPVSPVNWENVLESLASTSSGPFFFVKSPKTRIRLVCLEDDITRFYSGATTIFRGKAKTKYVVFGQVLSVDGGDRTLGEQWQNKIVPIVITKTTLSGIIAILAEGYDLFTPAEGFGITILKSGSGTDTDYNVNPSPHPVPLDMDELEQPEMSLEEYAAELTARSASRNGGSADGNGAGETSDW